MQSIKFTLFAILLIPLLGGVTSEDLRKPILNQNLPSNTAENISWKPGAPIALSNGLIVFDFQERLRYEYRNNTFDFNDSKNHSTDTSLLLQRLRLGVKVTPADWVSLYAQGQDSREAFSNRAKVPYVFGAEGDDTFDLYQGYLDLGKKEIFPLTLRLGRQVLAYGDERLIGGSDWNNFGRSFDALKLTWHTDAKTKTSVDYFIGNVVTVEGSDHQNQRDWEFNELNSKDLFTGIYGSSEVLSFQKTDLYVLYRKKERANPEYRITGGAGGLLPVNTPYDVDQDIWTMGSRILSTPGALNGFDYNAEAAYQFGTVSATQNTAGTNPSVTQGNTQQAFASHLEAGYRFEKAVWTPRLGMEYNFATGDSDVNDRKSETFMNLFPTNHKFYGSMDIVSLKNIHNLGVNISVKPTSKIILKVDGQAFWLADQADALYRANGVSQVRATNAAARNADTFVGYETDFTATYAYQPWLNFSLGYSHFFSGDYLKETSNTSNSNAAIVPSGDDADFFYFQTLIKL